MKLFENQIIFLMINCILSKSVHYICIIILIWEGHNLIKSSLSRIFFYLRDYSVNCLFNSEHVHRIVRIQLSSDVSIEPGVWLICDLSSKKLHDQVIGHSEACHYSYNHHTGIFASVLRRYSVSDVMVQLIHLTNWRAQRASEWSIVPFRHTTRFTQQCRTLVRMIHFSEENKNSSLRF